MELAGYDLHYAQIARPAHLLRRQIEGTFAGLGVGEVNFQVNVVGDQTVDNVLRATNPHLRQGNVLGIDFQVFGNAMELDGNVHGDFGIGIARHDQPKAYGQDQGEQLQPEVMEDVMLDIR